MLRREEKETIHFSWGGEEAYLGCGSEGGVP